MDNNYDTRRAREVVERPYNLIFVCVLYPLLQVVSYSLTGDIAALRLALILLTLWSIIMYFFTTIYKFNVVVDTEMV